MKGGQGYVVERPLMRRQALWASERREERREEKTRAAARAYVLATPPSGSAHRISCRKEASPDLSSKEANTSHWILSASEPHRGTDCAD